jgi:hypothetical protein
MGFYSGAAAISQHRNAPSIVNMRTKSGISRSAKTPSRHPSARVAEPCLSKHQKCKAMLYSCQQDELINRPGGN